MIIRFPELAEFSESSALFRKNSTDRLVIQITKSKIIDEGFIDSWQTVSVEVPFCSQEKNPDDFPLKYLQPCR